MSRVMYADDDIGEFENILGYMEDPLIDQEIDALIDEGAFMGVDYDNTELMGGFIVNLVKKIRDRIKARKAAGTLPTVSIQSPTGTTSLGPQGLNYTNLQQQQASGLIPVSSTSSPADMLKNPMVLAGLGVAAVLLLKNRGGGGKRRR